MYMDGMLIHMHKQVPDPRIDEYAQELYAHEAWWDVLCKFMHVRMHCIWMCTRAVCP